MANPLSLVALLLIATSLLGGSTICFAQTQIQSAGSSAFAPPYGLNFVESFQITISPGDLLQVQVFSTPELSGVLRVDKSGNISLPIAGSLKVGGLTPPQAETAVEKLLRDSKIMLDPYVSIFVSQFATKGITILGEVRTPGIYPIYGSHSLYDALAAAGGITPNQGSEITITHQDDPANPVVVPVRSPNYSALQRSTKVDPGDTIFISRADLIYVVGDVTKPGAVPIISGQPLTVLNVLALSSGLNRTAALKRAAIIRQSPNGNQTIPLNLSKIMKNADPDPVLQASDILVVPRSGVRTMLEYALPSVANAAASAASTAVIVH